jgi:hypothetical protein
MSTDDGQETPTPPQPEIVVPEQFQSNPAVAQEYSRQYKGMSTVLAQSYMPESVRSVAIQAAEAFATHQAEALMAEISKSPEVQMQSLAQKMVATGQALIRANGWNSSPDSEQNLAMFISEQNAVGRAARSSEDARMFLDRGIRVVPDELSDLGSNHRGEDRYQIISAMLEGLGFITSDEAQSGSHPKVFTWQKFDAAIHKENDQLQHPTLPFEVQMLYGGTRNLAEPRNPLPEYVYPKGFILKYHPANNSASAA